MKRLFLVSIIVCITFFTYQQLSFAAAAPPCPCDAVALPSGLTGNDIVDSLCPGGTLGPDSAFFFSGPGLIRSDSL